MKVIDITGLSGSGKSTLLPLIKRAFEQKGLTIVTEKELVNRLVKKKYYLIYIIINVFPLYVKNRLFNKLFKYNIQNINLKPKNLKLQKMILNINYKRNIPEFDKIKINNWISILIAKVSIADTCLRQEEYLLLDEAFVHRALSLFVSKEELSFSKELLAEYLKNIKNPEYLIVIITSINECKKRLNKRGLPLRFSGYSIPEISKVLSNSIRVIDCIIDYYTNTNTKILKLDNNYEFNANDTKDQILENIKKIIK